MTGSISQLKRQQTRSSLRDDFIESIAKAAQSAVEVWVMAAEFNKTKSWVGHYKSLNEFLGNFNLGRSTYFEWVRRGLLIKEVGYTKEIEQIPEATWRKIMPLFKDRSHLVTNDDNLDLLKRAHLLAPPDVDAEVSRLTNKEQRPELPCEIEAGEVIYWSPSGRKDDWDAAGRIASVTAHETCYTVRLTLDRRAADKKVVIIMFTTNKKD